MTTAKIVKKSNKFKQVRLVKKGLASDAIGKLEKDVDLYCLTFGQFSLIDVLSAILEQTGPAQVDISTWTAADAHLEKTAELIESMCVTRFRMIVDRSFETRQPAYCHRMRELFGTGCIRHVRSHAKFMVIKNDKWDIVVRTSMNLNENPRLENFEISDNANLCEFMTDIVDDIFGDVGESESRSKMDLFANLDEFTGGLNMIDSKKMKFEDYNEPTTTHAV